MVFGAPHHSLEIPELHVCRAFFSRCLLSTSWPQRTFNDLSQTRSQPRAFSPTFHAFHSRISRWKFDQKTVRRFSCLFRLIFVARHQPKFGILCVFITHTTPSYRVPSGNKGLIGTLDTTALLSCRTHGCGGHIYVKVFHSGPHHRGRQPKRMSYRPNVCFSTDTNG